MTQAQKRVAQPKPPRAPKATGNATRSHVAIRKTREIEDYADEGEALAESIGFAGEDDWVLNDIQVIDAKRYLAKVFYEIHVAALNPGVKLIVGKRDTNPTLIDVVSPSAASVCEHLGFELSSEEGTAIAQAVSAATARELNAA